VFRENEGLLHSALCGDFFNAVGRANAIEEGQDEA
jgi:hypothetical protein